MKKLYFLVACLVGVLGFGGGFGASCNPSPSPTPSPTPTPTPPPPAECCVIPSSGDSAWQSLGTVQPVFFAAQVKAAEDAIGDRCGKVPEESLDMLATALEANFICAARSVDSVFIEKPDQTFEQWHAIDYANGCWTVRWTDTPPHAYIGTWQYNGSLGSKCK